MQHGVEHANPVAPQPDLWDIDFTSAIENRTGKYFIGRDLIDDQRSIIGDIHYWRATRAAQPEGLNAQLLKLGMKLETRVTAGLRTALVPPRAMPRRTLHLDPISVLHSRLGRRDMVLVHDLGPITHADLFQPWLNHLYQRAYAKLFFSGARTVFVSAASRDAFILSYGITPGMSVIYPQIRVGARHAEPSPVAGIDGPFLLTVGSLGRRKNQVSAIRAFAKSRLHERGVSYVLCGAREPGAEEVDRVAASVPGVHLLPYVSDAELAWLYANAAGFVLMSRLEGFGMPVAEAISHGTIPLVTRRSVLEEVAGEGALAAAHHDLQEIAAGMIRLVDMRDEERFERRVTLKRAVARFTRENFTSSWATELNRG